MNRYCPYCRANRRLYIGIGYGGGWYPTFGLGFGGYPWYPFFGFGGGWHHGWGGHGWHR